MNIYYIDFENVNSQGLKGVELLTGNDEVYILYSKKADNMKIDTLTDLMRSKARISFLPVHVGTPNALDFQLVTLLYLHYDNSNHYFIISKDSGYDCCIKTGLENGAPHVQRFTDIAAAVRLSGARREENASQDETRVPAIQEQRLLQGSMNPSETAGSPENIQETAAMPAADSETERGTRTRRRSARRSRTSGSPSHFSSGESEAVSRPDTASENTDRIPAAERNISPVPAASAGQVEKQASAFDSPVLPPSLPDDAQGQKDPADYGAWQQPLAGDGAPSETAAQEGQENPDVQTGSPAGSQTLSSHSEGRRSGRRRRRQSGHSRQQQEQTPASQMTAVESAAAGEDLAVPFVYIEPEDSKSGQADEAETLSDSFDSSRPQSDAPFSEGTQNSSLAGPDPSEQTSESSEPVPAQKQPLIGQAENSPAQKPDRERDSDPAAGPDEVPQTVSAEVPARSQRQTAALPSELIRDTVQHRCGFIPDDRQLGVISGALQKTANKQQFYKYFVRQLGQKEGLQLYHSIRSCYGEFLSLSSSAQA